MCVILAQVNSYKNISVKKMVDRCLDYG